MKTLFKLTILGMLLPMLSAIAFAQTGPQSIYIDCESPSGSQSDLKRPRGDGNVWVFQIVPGADVHWVEGPNWNYPGKGGTDPSWGQWSGGDGSLSLSWISPEHSGAFNIGVTGKITCGSGGGGGAPIDISAMWSGEVLAKEWKPEPAISGGVLVKPQNQIATPADPAVVLVKPGSEVDCEVTEATDKDSWTEGGDEGEDDDTIKYKWTASSGGFVTDVNPTGDATFAETRTTKWKAPAEPGDYTLTCTINDKPAEVEPPDVGDRDDAPMERTVTVTVYDMAFISIKRVGGTGNTVAAGSLSGEHQADFIIQITPPTAGVSVSIPTVKSGGYGMTGDPDDPQFISAYASLNSGETDALGQIAGVFTSGHRTEDTVFEIDLNRGDSNPTGSIHQVWGNLLDGNSWDEEAEDNQPTYDVKWHYDPYFTIDDDLPVTYTIAFTEDGQAVPITGHNVIFSTVSITGLEWDPTAGEDWDEDGQPDGTYMQNTYSKQAAAAAQDAWDLLDPKPDDPPAELAKQINGWDKWGGLSIFGGTTANGGHYTADLKITDGINDADEFIFYVYEVGFDVTDFTAYDAGE